MTARSVDVWVLRGPDATRRTREALPAVLRQHLGHEPRVLRDRGGKPRLAGGALGFSVTHTDGIGLIAVADGAEVGVDAERLNPERVDLAVAGRFIGPEVAERLARLAPVARTRAFLQSWARLEAAAKGTGRGLDGRRIGQGEGVVMDLDLGPDHVGALWVDGSDHPRVVWHDANGPQRSEIATSSSKS